MTMHMKESYGMDQFDIWKDIQSRFGIDSFQEIPTVLIRYVINMQNIQ